MFRQISDDLGLRRLFLCAACFCLSGCQIFDIVIDVVQTEDAIEFFFNDKNDPSEVIEVHTVAVKDITAERIIWELNTFDDSEFYEEKNGRLLLNEKLIEEKGYPKITTSPLSSLKFGEIPLGFKQYFPRAGEIPRVKDGHNYIVSAYNGAHRGHAEFRVEKNRKLDSN